MTGMGIQLELNIRAPAQKSTLRQYDAYFIAQRLIHSKHLTYDSSAIILQILSTQEKCLGGQN